MQRRPTRDRSTFISPGAAALLAALLLACGSSSEDPEPEPPAAMGGTSPDALQPSSVTGQTPAGAAQPAAAESAPGSALGAASAPDLCQLAPDGDACASCVCDRCSEPMQTCTTTDGCSAILLCTQTSGCTDLDCFCGDAGLTECLSGAGNGPCRDVILDAPGGNAPSLIDPSAGPAAAAAQAVGECAQANPTCADACSP